MTSTQAGRLCAFEWDAQGDGNHLDSPWNKTELSAIMGSDAWIQAVYRYSFGQMDKIRWTIHVKSSSSKSGEVWQEMERKLKSQVPGDINIFTPDEEQIFYEITKRDQDRVVIRSTHWFRLRVLQTMPVPSKIQQRLEDKYKLHNGCSARMEHCTRQPPLYNSE
ncbi:hypothetical protein BKA66DRAFT_546875 [Pyrenochaeta sp. MPI-SDFR-AT-0127]|nr:hypothetical protein BKA66DRAFT_546875 [Pyrenochaeta sp. MPI-SDFR-AT-0127]